MSTPLLRLRPLALAAAAAVLAGCTTVAPDGGFGPVAEMAQSRTGHAPRVARSDADRKKLAGAIDAILKQPLGAEDAVRVALLNNPGLQARYWDVGLAQADLAQASRLPNPALGFKRTRGGDDIEIERSLTVSLVSALTTPLATRLEGRRFEQAKLAVAADIEKHAADTRRAWYEAVAAKQGVEYARQVNKAAEASAELTGRMAQAGNASQLDLAREQAF
jgi:outer membrane protein TolC